jgi:hypothetical protein
MGSSDEGKTRRVCTVLDTYVQQACLSASTFLVGPAATTLADTRSDRRRTVMESITSELGERGVDRDLGDVWSKSHPDQLLITTTSIQVSSIQVSA